MTDEQTGLPTTGSESTDEDDGTGIDPIIVAESWPVDDHRDATILDDDEYIEDPQWQDS